MITQAVQRDELIAFLDQVYLKKYIYIFIGFSLLLDKMEKWETRKSQITTEKCI